MRVPTLVVIASAALAFAGCQGILDIPDPKLRPPGTGGADAGALPVGSGGSPDAGAHDGAVRQRPPDPVGVGHPTIVPPP